jgi:hypothetical protein
MIVVTLMGGMGNQMFQYALGRNLSLKYNIPLKIDLSFLKNKNMGANFIYRDYDLNIFNVYEDFEIGQVNVKRINEPNFQYSSNISDMVTNSPGDNFLLNGYWQTPKYFEEFEEQIRKDFTFRDKVEDADDHIKDMLVKIKSTNSVLLNVRRTDYLNTNYHGVMGNEYLDKGVELIESKVENPHYFLFSDDVEWCKENIKYENMTIVDHSYKGDRFSYYLQLMKNCKHFIIPNSSFAWWAAWLNEGEDKIVITPEKWFTDSNINTSDLIPDNWIRI